MLLQLALFKLRQHVGRGITSHLHVHSCYVLGIRLLLLKQDFKLKVLNHKHCYYTQVQGQIMVTASLADYFVHIQIATFGKS